MISTQISLPGYQLSEQLYNGSRTMVYRAFRETDSKSVVIKLLKNLYPSFSELVQFRNQYTITKNLNSPFIIQTYSLEMYQNSYALVMEDFGGISLKEWNQNGETRISLQEFLQIAIAVCNALDTLHRERIIHKDIKPSNILINPETKQVKLIDFSIASLLPRETQALVSPNVLEGTLAYISPEQTGRMNRGIDYRTDFYSLGVTFYELLTGSLPFDSQDPIELVHCHLAKMPLLIGNRGQEIEDRKPKIPQVLSEIVMKLMAKNAENRYQSALGLKFDLENCLSQLQKTDKIESFLIAQRDACDRFIIPDKLYGREHEVKTLLQAFERVCLGTTEMMLVAGFSGIGKTAVVNEVHKPIVRQRGYFIKGKYDQFQRNVPLSAFVQAFQDLIKQLLTESDAQILQWKHRILEAVGENGQAIVEFLPELEKIIGIQPTVPELSGTAAQNRFNLLLQKFIQVFASGEHPLVIFLDDLQWADSASLKLMQLLMTDTKHLFVIGAYRDNEVNSAHPLMLTLREIKQTEATMNTMTLAPLSQVQVNDLVADTLKCTKKIALPLSQLVFQKTQGNPFFITQFLKALHQDKLIQFISSGAWQCDLTKVTQLALTDDVVAFMAVQLQKLPPSTRYILELAACIGNQFDLATLAVVAEQSEVETAAHLWKALQEGLILPISEVYKFYQQESLVNSHSSFGNSKQMTNDNGLLTVSYKFLHDRVQQAAYSLIPDDQKRETHLQIGQLLQQNFSENELEEKLFDMVGHLNQGQALIITSEDREALAQLNLKAGAKANTATAYVAARIYFQTGINLLQPDCWQSQYELALKLYVAAAEASYLNGDFQGMEQIASLVLQQAQTILDKVQIYKIQIAARTVSNQVLEAIAVGREVLVQLGIDFPLEVDETRINKILQDQNQQLQGREIAGLIDLPKMSDPIAQAAMQVLGTLFLPISLRMPGLLPVLSERMMKLSLQYGNAPTSTVGYVTHGMVLCAFLGEVKTGYEFGSLALSLLERLNERAIKPIILNLFVSFIQHHQESLRATLLTLKEGYMTGMETGDFLNAGYNIVSYTCNGIFAGVDLDTLETESVIYSGALTQVKQDLAQIFLGMARQTVRNLRETASQPDCLMGNAYDEIVMLPKHRQDNDSMAIAVCYIYKLLLAYCFGKYLTALDYITQAKHHVTVLSGLVLIPIFHFYAALTHLALLPTQLDRVHLHTDSWDRHEDTEPEQLFAQAINHQTILHQWAQNGPINYLHKWYLVEAERYRVLGDRIAAIESYDCAITLAKKHQFINEAALANELAAKFYLDWDKARIAQEYTIEAYYGYARWGAKAKVTDLESRYPQLLATVLQQTATVLKPTETVYADENQFASQTFLEGIGHSASTALDLSAILKASQKLESKIQLDKLLSALLEITIATAGADNCVLMLLDRNRLSIEATYRVGQSPMVLQSIPVSDSEDVPRSLVNAVKHTMEPIVTSNATVHPLFSTDPYFLRQQPKSLLCMPILHQGTLLGLLYLENNLATGVFTSDRVELLNLLCTQAAISLENARLYERSQNYAQQLEQALHNLQNAQLQIVQSEKMSALGNLVAGVAHEMNNPLGFISASLLQAQPIFNDVIEHLKLYQEAFPSPGEIILNHAEEIDLEYSLEDLPKMINSMTMVCDRLKNISISLRTFSRADRDYKVLFDIHEGIDSTILILKHRLKTNEQRPAIQVKTDYGKIPQILCFPGQLNQVFMNILANAIDAIEDSFVKSQESFANGNIPTITISTNLINSYNFQQIDRDGVVIQIQDNGVGMTDEVKQKIFDRLFTTKSVGKGTGLGLAIAKAIVEDTHGGAIKVFSTLGQGTKFVITLPIN